MAKRSFKVSTFTFVAVADTVNYTNSGYMGLMGGSTTQFINVSEVFVSGLATSSTPQITLLSRDSTVQATPTALTTNESDAPLHPSTAALAAPAVSFTASTTKPQRSATLGLLNVSLNLFGGLIRWVAYPGEEIGVLGNTASLGEVSLSAMTGSAGLAAAHLIYEPF